MMGPYACNYVAKKCPCKLQYYQTRQLLHFEVYYSAINPREARALTAVATATEIFGITCTTFRPKEGCLACKLEGVELLEAVEAPVPVCATCLL
eukprot:670042-Prorocentrum_minimum.AAC.2